MLTQTDRNKIALVEWALELIYDQVPKTIDEFVKIGAIQIPTNQDAAPIVIVKKGLDNLARALGVKTQDFHGIKGRCHGFLFVGQAGQAVMFLEGEEATIGTEK